MRQFDELAALELGITLRFEGEGEGEIGIVAAIDSFAPALLQTPGQSAFEHASGAQAKVKVGDVVVKVDPRYFRPTEVETLLGDPSKAKAKLGWEPTTTLPELVAEMVTADFHSARRDNLVKQAGYQAYDHHE